MSEKDKRQIQEAGAQVLTTLHALTRVLMLYETNNTAVLRLLDTWRPTCRRTLRWEIRS